MNGLKTGTATTTATAATATAASSATAATLAMTAMTAMTRPVYPHFPLRQAPAPAPALAPGSDALCTVPGCAVACWSMGLDAPDTAPCPHGWGPSPDAAPVTDSSPLGDR
ncbi:hypothetical protein [Streptomyces sp. H27-C3]|uniref:hypothetical protein n=1 Tax=Streptomyces sp. H27-C3 TaxID=3046305 RepID=UPI0024BAF217|nr:hypothetical protein [Streptomyces sp. H27-C3]MDJ0465888.1 hypothetical protein [Streptomyces sp. H27-C3]